MTESDEARHWRSLLACSRLIRWIRRMYYPRVLRITAQHVVTLLHEAGIEFVLIGSHGVSGWRDQPQASEDVDLLVRLRDLDAADQVVRGRYRTLIPRRRGTTIEYCDPRTHRTIVDIKTPATPLGRMLWRTSADVHGVYRVPALEAAIVSLFVSFKNQRRELSKRYWHAGDFWNVVEHQRNVIDFRKVRELSRAACGADRAQRRRARRQRSAELTGFVKDILAGRKIVDLID